MSVQLHTYVQHRLNRWMIWIDSGTNPKPAPVISGWGIIMRGNVQQTGAKKVHVDATEADLTDRAIRALVAELRLAIYKAYLGRGTMEQKARDLGITRMTLNNRLDRAYGVLLGYFSDLEAGEPLPPTDILPPKIKLTRLYKISNIPVTVA